jgi:hypothetical protein
MTMSPAGREHADQHITVGRRFDRIGPVGDRAANQPGLAAVAYPGPARPSYGDIARFGEFEEALER